MATIDPSYRKYFIENDRSAGYWEWFFSRGTNYTCYEQFMNDLTEEKSLNNKIDVIHKLGNLMPRYYANIYTEDPLTKQITVTCQTNIDMPEKHPFKWFITRQLGVMFWFTGEIFADWYPLLRTRAVARNTKSIYVVYATCILFNLSKVSMMVYHFTLSPTELYKPNGEFNSNRIDEFYLTYWLIHLIIIYSSLIYDFSVFFVLKKSVFNVQSDIGFLKKFRSMSEFRILISVFISIVFLPIISVTIILRYVYYYGKNFHSLNFSFDEIRQMIANVQYFMIFIDQIMLIISKQDSHTVVSSTNSYYPYNGNGNGNGSYYYNNKSNNSNKSNISLNGISNSSSIKHQLSSVQSPSNIHFQNLMNITSINNDYNNKNQMKSDIVNNNNFQMDNYEFSPTQNFGFLNNHNRNSSVSIHSSHSNRSRNSQSKQERNKKKTIANYDDYNGANTDEWSYLP
ncbi:hypothetical protein PIROE2DRAFT_8091 [Piromyces sp. E2]|nr:hypothetical protein PIROE2DRAFT_8091 [Piromyces sp. E2]|eukprot:OUM65028.1 hypothetical protein PIROE2DRAFT_8091 [Piromyces sp. E2]